MTDNLRPLFDNPIWRTSSPNKHRGEGRQIVGTSKDVMPAKAGYTSTSLCKWPKHA